MFDTTTELQNIGSTNIVTPTIRVKMRANTHFTTQVPISKMSRIYDATIFKDRNILFGLSYVDLGPSALSFGLIETLTLDGNSSISVAAINTQDFNPIGRFKITGDTLNFFYTDSRGSTFVIRSIATGDGLTWGASERVFAGTSSAVRDLAVVGPTQIYTLRVLGSTIALGYTGTKETVCIDTHKYNGSWGSTHIDSDAFFIDSPSEINYDHKIIADRVAENTDRILVQFANSRDSRVGVKAITTDGTKAFGSFDLISSEISNEQRLIAMTNLVKHSDEYYLGVQITDRSYIVDGGVTSTNGYSSPLMYLKSKNLLDWSIPYMITGVTREVGALPVFNHIGAIASGITSDLNFTWYGVSHLYVVTNIDNQSESNINIYTGRSQLDLSSDLITYQNLNNERINMTIGNYRSVIAASQGGASVPVGVSSGFQYLLLALGWLP